MDDLVQGPRRRRRTHGLAFKAQVLQACRQPGASIAAVAQSNGLNAGLVRRWLTEHDTSSVSVSAAQQTQRLASSSTGGGDMFVPVHVTNRPAEAAVIRLEVRRGCVAMNVIWPAQEASACGAWLREWLR